MHRISLENTPYFNFGREILIKNYLSGRTLGDRSTQVEENKNRPLGLSNRRENYCD